MQLAGSCGAAGQHYTRNWVFPELFVHKSFFPRWPYLSSQEKRVLVWALIDWDLFSNSVSPRKVTKNGKQSLRKSYIKCRLHKLFHRPSWVVSSSGTAQSSKLDLLLLKMTCKIAIYCLFLVALIVLVSAAPRKLLYLFSYLFYDIN